MEGKDSEIVEKAKEITNIPMKAGLTKAEVNFLQYPIGTLDKHFKGTSVVYKDIIRSPQGQEDIYIKWEVSANTKYGLPGPTAVALDNAITKLIQDPVRQVDGRIPKWLRTSLYELTCAMGRQPGGAIYETIKDDLYRLASVTITSHCAFRQKDHKEPIGGAILHKYQGVALYGEPLPAGVPKTEADESGRATQVYIVLSEPYWYNLKAHYTKPIDHGFMVSLRSPVLQRMYQLLSLAFQTRMREAPLDNRPCVNYNYVEFCGRLPLKGWEKKHLAKGHIKRYLDKIVRSGYLEGYRPEFEGSQDRWFIRFFPGPKAKEELERVAGQRLLFDIIEPGLKRTKSKKTKVVQHEKESIEKQKLDVEEKEYKEILRRIQSLPDQTIEKLKESAIESLKQKGDRFVTKFGTEVEMVSLFKSSQTLEN